MVVASPRKDEKAEPSSVWPGAREGAEMGREEAAPLGIFCDGLSAALVVRSSGDDSLEAMATTETDGAQWGKMCVSLRWSKGAKWSGLGSFDQD